MGRESILSQLESFPEEPGVYMFKDENGNILYIGKARNLKARLKQYASLHIPNRKTQLLVSKVQKIDYIITESEEEAFLLEQALIQKHTPPYNVMWRDGKSYPYICILKERFPRVIIMRRPSEDKAECYGPYTSKVLLEELYNLIRELFPLRTCAYNLSEENIKKGKFKKCLEYHIGKCKAPCVGMQSEEDYNQTIAQVRKILKGNIDPVIKYLNEAKQKAVENLEFEKAEEIKQKINLLKRYAEKATIVRGFRADIDVIAYKATDKMAFVHYMQIRNGLVVLTHNLKVAKKLNETDEELLANAIIQLRNRFKSNVKEVIVPFDTGIKIEGVELIVPVRGDKSILLQVAEKNLNAYIDREFPEYSEKPHPALSELQRILELPTVPERIECFDISTLMGTQTVASLVVFLKGKPAKREYRRFLIKHVDGIDDYGSMKEAVHRRFKRLLEEEGQKPDLLLIDGGPGQAGIAYDVLKELGFNIPVYGLAKRLEILYPPHSKSPIYIDRRSPVLLLLQRIRNEAHRFALHYQRKRRELSTLKSELLEVPGIGKRRAEELLKHFGSIKRIKEASFEEIAEVVGPSVAQKLQEWLRSV